MKRKGWHLAPLDDEIDWDAAFRRDPDGLCHAVTKALNDLLMMDPDVNGWSWSADWQNLPGAISVVITGSALNAESWDCPKFIAATSVASYDEVDGAAQRLQDRIRRTLAGWKRPN